MPSSEGMHVPAVLTSWKEIAAYLGKGVRTVQRWEKDDGLPIRRIAGTSKIVVHREELDEWLRSQPAQNGGSPLRTELRLINLNLKPFQKLAPANVDIRDSVVAAMQDLIHACRRVSSACAGIPVRDAEIEAAQQLADSEVRMTAVGKTKADTKAAPSLTRRVS